MKTQLFNNQTCDWENCKKKAVIHVDLEENGDDSDHLDLCVEHVKALKEESKQYRGYNENDWKFVDKLQRA